MKGSHKAETHILSAGHRAGGGGGVDSAHSTVGRSMTKGASSGGDWTQQKGGDSDA